MSHALPTDLERPAGIRDDDWQVAKATAVRLRAKMLEQQRLKQRAAAASAALVVSGTRRASHHAAVAMPTPERPAGLLRGWAVIVGGR